MSKKVNKTVFFAVGLIVIIAIAGICAAVFGAGAKEAYL